MPLVLRRLALTLLPLAAACAARTAADPRPPALRRDASPSADSGHVLEGIVRDDRTHAPIAGAQVGLHYADSTLGQGVVFGGVTDAAGIYRIRQIRPGPYLVWVRRVGYVPERRTVYIGACGLVGCRDVVTRSFFLDAARRF